ncbi:MAG TPA: hypothetical protein VK187_10355, partial [Geobacteraceae bacterium]|nr:hypothetical protein [Geobacteraceae bacterium]
WGENSYGQLGNGTTAESHAPAQVTGLAGVAAITAGWSHTVALKNDGTVWAWGDNYYGQLGDGTTTESHAPVQVAGLAGVIKVAAGGLHTVAVKNDGTVWSWGENSYGQLGNGTTAESHAPAQVTGLAGVITVAAGDSHTVALKNDGTVWSWGGNDFSQIGDGTTTQRLSPVPVTVNAVTLTTILAGTGGGSVHSNPSGLSCSLGTCTMSVPSDTSVTLIASPNADSFFAGWSGGGCAGQSDCTITMSVNTTVYAVFDYVEPVKIQGGNFYSTLSGAYTEAKNGDPILARTFGFKEDLVLGRDIIFILKGGYDTSFANNPDMANLEGILTVARGAITIENLVIK